MIRNHKLLGIAFAAMLALSAFAAQAASAKPLTVTGAGSTVYVTGAQEAGTPIIFRAPAHGGEVKCAEAHYLGHGEVASGAVNELTVSQSYPTKTKAGALNCTAFGFADTHIADNGCKFTFTTPTSIKTGEVTWSSEQAHLTCETGKQITITPTSFGVSVCTQNIAAQTPTGGHTIGTNITHNGKMAITLNVTVTGIHYIGTGGACGTNGVTTTDGTLTGSANVTCFSDEARLNQIDCTFS